MNRNTLLTVMSVLTIFIGTLHLSSDMVLGLDRMKPSMSIALAVIAFWLYVALAMPPRWPRYVILLIMSFVAAAIPWLHTSGRGISPEFAKQPGAFLLIWGLIAMGITASLSFGLCVHGLWHLRRDHGAA